MRLGSLASRAKELIEKRGGTESLKRDAEELRTIARSRGSFSDKAKRAAEAVKEPGAGPRTEYDPAAGPAHAEPSPDRSGPERGSRPSETARRRQRRERSTRRR